MNHMPIAEIIKEIDWTLAQAQMRAALRAGRLEELALRLWAEAFPDVKRGGMNKLTPEQLKKGWAPIREEIDRYQSRDRIYKVADWPGSGGDLSRV